MDIEETRAAVERLQVPCMPVPQQHWDRVMEAADAYGAARELKGHVDTCGAYQPVHPNAPESGPACGDGWICDKGKEIEEAK